jgi:mitochondrial inner membrane protease subunit SOM1
MAPPIEAWPAYELPSRLQALPSGRRRKPDVDLANCPLFELTQYDCVVERRGNSNTAKVGKDNEVHKPSVQGKAPKGEIVCTPIMRLFRRYA